MFKNLELEMKFDNFTSVTFISYIDLGKVKCSRYRPGVAQRVGRNIALLFLDRGTRRG